MFDPPPTPTALALQAVLCIVRALITLPAPGHMMGSARPGPLTAGDRQRRAA
jgi:hypothetical protein